MTNKYDRYTVYRAKEYVCSIEPSRKVKKKSSQIDN